MATIREVRDSFQTHRSAYVEILEGLQAELRSATTEADAAKSTLAPLIAAALARAIPDLNAPAIQTFDHIGKDLGLKQSPLTEKDRLLTRRSNAQAEISEITRSNGSEATITTALTASRTATQDLQRQAGKAREEIAQHDAVLEPFENLNRKLTARGLSPVELHNLARFSRPSGGMAALWRWATDPAYRIARPVLDQLEAANVNIWIELNLRTEEQQDLNRLQTEEQKKKAETSRLDLALTRLQECKNNQPSDREIVNTLRLTVSKMMENGDYLSAVTQAMPDLLPPEASALHTRATLMGKLAARLRETIKDAKPAATGLKDSLRDLNRAVGRSRDNVAVKNFDLSDRERKLRAHQNVARQRLQASREIRNATRNNAASTSSNDNDLLLWCLYMNCSDNSSAQTASAAPFSGQGGRAGGGGASGQWEDNSSPNSYFRADMLGVTPQNALRHGIDPASLRIPPDVQEALSVSAPDTGTSNFNTLSADTVRLPTMDFNTMGGTAGSTLPQFDLGSSVNLSDCATSVSDFASSICNFGD